MPPLNVTLSFHQIDFGAGVPVFELQALGLNQDDAGEVNLVLPHRNFVMCIGTRSWNVAIILTSWAYEVSVAVHLPVESEAVERGGGGGLWMVWKLMAHSSGVWAYLCACVCLFPMSASSEDQRGPWHSHPGLVGAGVGLPSPPHPPPFLWCVCVLPEADHCAAHCRTEGDAMLVFDMYVLHLESAFLCVVCVCVCLCVPPGPNHVL